MYARMTVARPRPGQFHEALSAVQDHFLTAARAQPGYAGFLILSDESDAELVGISLWDSAASLRASAAETGYYQQQITAFAELLSTPSMTGTYQVEVAEGNLKAVPAS